MAYGTLTLADLQATQNASTVAQVGLEEAFEAIQNTLTAHNRIVAEMTSALMTKTTTESERYGGPDSGVMEDLDEQGVPRAQKVTGGLLVGYPLNAVGYGMQWTDMWLKKHTVAELSAQVSAMMDADVNRIIRDMKRAIYYSANYTFTDHLARNIDLGVKRLVNGDGNALPVGPNGETFATSHTHYIPRAGASFAASDLTAWINSVKEHYATGDIQVWINQADEATVRALSGFVAYLDPRLMQANNVASATNRTLDLVSLYDRAIGLYEGAEVWVKPYAVASYPLVINASADKPLAYRYDPDYGDGLMPILDQQSGVLFARAFRRVFGIGVRNRIAAAVGYTGGTTYTDPTIS